MEPAPSRHGGRHLRLNVCIPCDDTARVGGEKLLCELLDVRGDLLGALVCHFLHQCGGCYLCNGGPAEGVSSANRQVDRAASAEGRERNFRCECVLGGKRDAGKVEMTMGSGQVNGSDVRRRWYRGGEAKKVNEAEVQVGVCRTSAAGRKR